MKVSRDINLDTLSDLLSVADLRVALGIGKAKAYDLLRTGKINYVKISGSVRIPKTSLIDYLETRAKTTKADRLPKRKDGINAYYREP